MQYKYAAVGQNYSDLASGRVLTHTPGQVAFPVRLASEVFQRCTALLEGEGNRGPYSLYDPCCGAAYHLTALGFLHNPEIGAIIGSDVSGNVLETASANLSLLTPEGLEARTAQIQTMAAAYGKESHREALESARRLRQTLVAYRQDHVLKTQVFLADATRPLGPDQSVFVNTVDIVFTDLPYGQLSSWTLPEGWTDGDDPGTAVLSTLLESIQPHAVVAVATSNRQKLDHPKYRRLSQIRAGKRRITLFRPIG